MTCETIHLTIPGLSRPYLFYYTSDAHVTDVRSDESEEMREIARKADKAWSYKGIMPKDALDQALLSADGEHADGIFLCGDIVNYYNEATLSWVRNRLEKTATELLYVCGNHERAVPIGEAVNRECYGAYRGLMPGDPAGWVRDYGEFLVVGLDNGDKDATQAQLDFLRTQIDRGKPILLLLHIPLTTESIVDPVREKWGENGYRYFLFGNPEDSDGSHRLCELVKRPDNHILAVFAGHIHRATAGEFAPGRIQYTSAPTFEGTVWRVEVTGEHR